MDNVYHDILLNDAIKAKVYMNNNYGLIQLLNSIKPNENQSFNLTTGTDLTLYGIDFNYSEPYFPFYTNPWSESNIRHNLRYLNASCYRDARPPKNSHITNFNIDTLFYIFYNMPKHVLHEYAVLELYNSNWIFNTHYKIWLTNKQKTNSIHNMSQNLNPSQIFVWTYFDPYQWEFKLFPGTINKQHFLPMDELRRLLYNSKDEQMKGNLKNMHNYLNDSDFKF